MISGDYLNLKLPICLCIIIIHSTVQLDDNFHYFLITTILYIGVITVDVDPRHQFPEIILHFNQD